MSSAHLVSLIITKIYTTNANTEYEVSKLTVTPKTPVSNIIPSKDSNVDFIQNAGSISFSYFDPLSLTWHANQYQIGKDQPSYVFVQFSTAFDQVKALDFNNKIYLFTKKQTLLESRELSPLEVTKYTHKYSNQDF